MVLTSTVHQAASHVLSVTRVTLGHHVAGFEYGVGNFRHGQILVKGFCRRDDWSIRGQHEVNAGIRNQVGLEFRNIHVECSVETKRGREGRNDLGNQAVQVGVSGTFNVQVATADIVQGFVVEAKGAISVLQQGVGGEDRVVGLDNRGRDLRRRGHGKRELGLAAVVHTQTFEQERTKTTSCAPSSGMEDKKSLKAGAVVGKLTNAIQDQVDNLLPGRVVTASIIVGGVFLAVNDLFGVIQVLVCSTSHFVTNGRFQVNVNGTRDVFSGRRFTKEGVEGIIGNSQRLIRWHGAVLENAVLEAVQFPALITRLDTSLTQMNRDTF